jgi:Secretion system C-terminal sorting domain
MIRLMAPIFVLLLIVLGNTGFTQSHRYIFNNDFVEFGAAGPNLTEVLSCGATNGSFGAEVVTTTAGTCSNSIVFNFNEGGGLAYPNNPAFINDTYTIHMFYKFNAFSGYQRIIDFKNSTTDRGIYTLNDCLNFYPNGPIGPCPYFVNGNFYYLITLVRNGATKAVSIYVNGILFSTYTDAADDYVPTTTTTPILFFRDDNAFACEDRSGAIKYLELKPDTSSAAEVLSTWNYICSIALPLRLLDFSATVKNQNVQLQWRTDNEINSDRFEVEKSINGLHYTKIATVRSVSNSGANNYTFLDVTQLTTIQYYRLKMIDKDGSYTYSRVVPVLSKQSNNLIVFPNPVKDVVTIVSPANQTALISDAKGQVVARIKLLKGSQPIDVSAFGAGVYFLKTETEIIKLLKY